MPIQTICTCGQSLTGFCARDIRECKQLFLTEMDNLYNYEDMEEKKYPIKWEYKNHSYAIGDTGDYDGYWEVTNGRDSLVTKEDYDEIEKDLQAVVDLLNITYANFAFNRDVEAALEAENKWLRCELEELKKQPGAAWVKGAPTERKLFHARFKGHLSDDIHDGIIEPVKDPEYWQAIASGVRISIKGHRIIEYLDESGQSKEGNKPSVTDITNTLEYYQGVIASLADKEDEAFSKGVHHQRIGMLHEAIETIKKYKQYLQDNPLTLSRADFIREANNRDLAAAPTAWIRADVKRPDGWQLARFLNSRKRFPVKFSPHVITDMVGKTYEPQELEYLSDEGSAAAGREEDACDFAEWMRLNCKSSEIGWVDALGKWDTTKGWYELFKQNEKQ